MTPRISFVVAAHNPRYAGDNLERAQVWLRGVVELASRYDLRCEIVFVEWNPHPENGRFREGLCWPVDLGPVLLRFIEVPPEVHRRFPNSNVIPIFEYLAKNVGLRRARGEYLLATNPDVLYNPPLFQFLAQGSFQSGRFYRIDRRDLSRPLPADWTLDRQLRFCKKYVDRVHALYGSYRIGSSLLSRYWTGCWRGRKLKREYRLYRNNMPTKASPTNKPDALLILPADGLHRNASGDFFMMHRRHWFDLRGYPEIFTHSHVDAILCWVAASAGLEQVVLETPCRLYHQFHQRHDHKRFPQTNWHPWYERYLEALAGRGSLVVNSEAWGLSDETFDEWSFGPGRASAFDPLDAERCSPRTPASGAET